MIVVADLDTLQKLRRRVILLLISIDNDFSIVHMNFEGVG